MESPKLRTKSESMELAKVYWAKAVRAILKMEQELHLVYETIEGIEKPGFKEAFEIAVVGVHGLIDSAKFYQDEAGPDAP